MAVPTSGTLTIEGLAQEALYGTYGSGTITAPIFMYDLVNGGNSAGSGNSYPLINRCCLPNPIDGTGASYYAFTLHQSGSSALTVYTTRVLTTVTVGTIIYANTAGGIYTGGGNFISGPSGTAWAFCSGGGGCPAISTDTSTGAITGTGCGCP